MDGDCSTRDNDESIVHNQSPKPDNLPLHHLEEITNNFSVERVLGKGGFGVVYKGVRQNGEMVAVKKLVKSIPTCQKQFENEVHLLMRLKHPNIVQFVGYCYETKNILMVYNGKSVFVEMTERLLCLEYVPKGSLDRHISDESSGLDWHARFKIIKGICHGLHYLHEEFNKTIIHLDLKPANILLDDNMIPKITDFGLSRLLDQQQTILTQATNGTFGYMPPEYLHRGTITPMSDIFSLGVIILEVIMGHKNYPDVYTDVNSTTSEEFIELTLQKWRNVLEKAPDYTSLEIHCQQIKGCIQIGLICVNPERTKRPMAKKIIKMLQGLESTDCHVCNEVTPQAAQASERNREEKTRLEKGREEKERQERQEEARVRSAEKEREQGRTVKERDLEEQKKKDFYRERQAVQKVLEEVRQRAASEARAKAETSTHQRAQRLAVQRVQEEVRERAAMQAQKVKKEVNAATKNEQDREVNAATKEELDMENQKREVNTATKEELDRENRKKEREAVERVCQEAADRAYSEICAKAKREAIQRTQQEALERAQQDAEREDIQRAQQYAERVAMQAAQQEQEQDHVQWALKKLKEWYAFPY